MKNVCSAALFFAALVPIALAQNNVQNSPGRSNAEMQAITNLRKLAAGESSYAMSHPGEGFACNPQALTQLEWANSQAKLVEPALLSGTRDYKFSAICPQDSKPGTKLNVFGVPIDPRANLRTFCATETFGPYKTAPYVATGESPIRSVSAGNAESCLTSGEALK